MDYPDAAHEFEILKVGDNLFGVCCGALLKRLNPFWLGLCELCLDRFHVALEHHIFDMSERWSRLRMCLAFKYDR